MIPTKALVAVSQGRPVGGRLTSEECRQIAELMLTFRRTQVPLRFGPVIDTRLNQIAERVYDTGWGQGLVAGMSIGFTLGGLAFLLVFFMRHGS